MIVGDASRFTKVLVVDDDPDITRLYKKALEEDRATHVAAYNDPKEALSEFKPNTFDITLIDVRMPNINGFDLYEEIKKLDPYIKVCFITGFEVNYRALQELFPELAKESFISKPTTMKQLKDHVRYILEASQ